MVTAMSKKGRQVFQEKNRGVTPSVAAPCVTHPSDATVKPFAVNATRKVNGAVSEWSRDRQVRVSLDLGKCKQTDPHKLLVLGVAQVLIERTVTHLS